MSRIEYEWRGLAYSYRSALMGSTRMARRAASTLKLICGITNWLSIQGGV
jgi:hypothetical protein